ncbi:Ypt/Rab-GAP domain of gyp1p superfamily protein isoform 3 [Hibiscus syriacus]|uniref:Ypt/Rab-GAP domain of gyp1p superfamily protein isoform 3 n=1 Tax=Hibiscus syriacus TaxID=106335 RepID=A0A6A3B566_HIBSY|nr:Ypt/Rab-GAP domain of gyp1p superfamily protein isoform 3 [Hibiscus syriacus]
MSKEIVKEEAPSLTCVVSAENRTLGSLRSVRWRLNLGILAPSPSLDDLRRETADSRRRYAGLRRRLLLDPHVPKNGGSNSPDLVMDNPLSQNPDSTWGRFFRNVELEKMVDQDLSRLYPEHGSYFQALGCQGMLRRILLLWCLRHPEFGYRQGMHELQEPLLYVLHVDVKESLRNSMEDEVGSQGNSKKVRSVDELDPELQTIILLTDAYGAEGELGIVLSEKFMEHDAYCMFEALMSGARGAVAMQIIVAMAVSMMLFVRSSLLATENATTCLQRLLSFPENINLKKLVAKAKSLQILALDFKISSSLSTCDVAYNRSKSAVSDRNLSSGSVSPKTPLSLVPDSYWEGKWRVLHKAEELRQDSLDKHAPSGKRRWSEKVKPVLSRTESDPSPARAEKYKKGHRSSVRCSLLEDLSQQLGLEEDTETGDRLDSSNLDDRHFIEVQVETQNDSSVDSICTAEERCESGSGASQEQYKSNTADSSTASAFRGVSRNSSPTSQRDVVDQNVIGTLKNLGQSMLEHIQVLESVFQQDRVQVGSSNNLVGKGQVIQP